MFVPAPGLRVVVFAVDQHAPLALIVLPGAIVDVVFGPQRDRAGSGVERSTSR